MRCRLERTPSPNRAPSPDAPSLQPQQPEAKLPGRTHLESKCLGGNQLALMGRRGLYIQGFNCKSSNNQAANSAITFSPLPPPVIPAWIGGDWEGEEEGFGVYEGGSKGWWGCESTIVPTPRFVASLVCEGAQTSRWQEVRGWGGGEEATLSVAVKPPIGIGAILITRPTPRDYLLFWDMRINANGLAPPRLLLLIFTASRWWP